MFITKNKIYQFCLLLILSIPKTFSMDSVDFDLVDSDMLAQAHDNAIRASTSPEEVISIIEAIGGIDILKHNLFLRTNPLNKRSLLDYPNVFEQKLAYDHCHVFGSYLFYNQTTRTNFTWNSNSINSYLAICDPDLLDAIAISAEKIAGIAPNATLDPISIIPLFNNATVQDRRVGLMLHLLTQHERFNFRFFTPLYYQERNYFLTDQEREDIETELGALTDDQQKKFQKDSLICDKIGFGDTRLELEFPLRDQPNYYFSAALQTTIPTAFAFIPGIEGSTYPKCQTRPSFNFTEFFEIAQSTNLDKNQKAQMIRDILQKFFTGALDQMGANLLDTSMGNESHFGLGGFIRVDNSLGCLFNRPWAEPITWYNKVTFEYLFPATEKRFFVDTVNLEAFSSRDFSDPNQAADNLNFLQQEFVNRFYPFVYKADVYPGFVAHWISRFFYEGRRWGLELGNDIWTQGQEHLRNIHGKDIKCNNLDVDAATLPFAFQSKIIGALYFKSIREAYLVVAGLNFDYTYLSRGIGKDFTVALNLEINF